MFPTDLSFNVSSGECNYGGRVTDDKDRRLLMSLLSIFYNRDLLEKDHYELCEGGLYYVPAHSPYQVAPAFSRCKAAFMLLLSFFFQEYIKYIRHLPICADPCVFGLHSNADITKDNQETNQLLNGILLTLPRQTSGGGKSPQVGLGSIVCRNVSSRDPRGTTCSHFVRLVCFVASCRGTRGGHLVQTSPKF